MKQKVQLTFFPLLAKHVFKVLLFNLLVEDEEQLFKRARLEVLIFYLANG